MYLISKSGLMASERKIRDTENLLFTMVSMAKILFIFFSPNKCLVKKEENVFLIVSFSWCHPFLQGRLCIAKMLKKMLNSHRCVLEWITVLVTVCYILCCLILSTLHFRNDASILFFFLLSVLVNLPLLKTFACFSPINHLVKVSEGSVIKSLKCHSWLLHRLEITV